MFEKKQKRILKKFDLEKMAKIYVEDSKILVDEWRNKKLPEKMIEELQEKHLQFLILSALTSSGMPKAIQLKILDELRLKIQRNF